MECPNLKRTEYTLVNIESDGYVTLLDGNGETREDLKLPEDKCLKSVTD